MHACPCLQCAHPKDATHQASRSRLQITNKQSVSVSVCHFPQMHTAVWRGPSMPATFRGACVSLLLCINSSTTAAQSPPLCEVAVDRTAVLVHAQRHPPLPAGCTYCTKGHLTSTFLSLLTLFNSYPCVTAGRWHHSHVLQVALCPAIHAQSHCQQSCCQCVQR